MGHPVILSASLFHRKKGLGDKTATMGFWAFWPGVGFYPREFADLGMAFLLTRGGSGYAAKQIWLMANQQTLAMA